MSQEKLADQIGITFQQIQKYENGVNRISASRLFELSKALNVPVGLFFENIEFSQPAADFGVMAESDQTAIDGMDDIMTRKETLELIRVYYSIDDPKLRKDLFKLLRGMADNLKKQS